MRKIPTPEHFKKLFYYKSRGSRKNHPQAHVSEVIYCLRKAKLSRFDEHKKFRLKSSLAIRRGLALETDLLRTVESQIKFIDRYLIASLDGLVRDDKTKEIKYGVELKTRAISGDNVVSEHYINQVILYEYISELNIILIVYSCFKSKEGTDELDFLISTDEDYDTRGKEWYEEMQQRGKILLDSVFNNPDEILEGDPQYDWECNYCNYWLSCPYIYRKAYDVMTESNKWGTPRWKRDMICKCTGYNDLRVLKKDIKEGKYDIDTLLEISEEYQQEQS